MTFEQDCERMFRKSLEQLNRFVEMNAPPCVVAGAIATLVIRAEGFCGPELQEALLRRRVEDLRQRLAYCNQCDNQVSVARSNHPVCEHCDAKLEAEFGEGDE